MLLVTLATNMSYDKHYVFTGSLGGPLGSDILLAALGAYFTLSFMLLALRLCDRHNGDR